MLEDSVGLGIWRGERRTMAVGSDEDVGCRGEVVWNVGLQVVLVGLSGRNIFSEDFSEAMDIFMRRSVREEFCWNNEWITVDHFSGGNIKAIFRSGPKSKEDPGELVSPGSIGEAGDESGFQRPVHSFYHAIGFGVVGRHMVTR